MLGPVWFMIGFLLSGGSGPAFNNSGLLGIQQLVGGLPKEFATEAQCLEARNDEAIHFFAPGKRVAIICVPGFAVQNEAAQN